MWRTAHMLEATIEIWSSKSRDYGTYSLFEKDELIKTYTKYYNTYSSKRALSFARRFKRKMERDGKLTNNEATVITIK